MLFVADVVISSLGRTPIFLNTVELVNDVSDEKKFPKYVGAGLIEVRRGVGDGLFTAFNDEPSWGVARKI